jgi:hypothetical protein
MLTAFHPKSMKAPKALCVLIVVSLIAQTLPVGPSAPLAVA